MSFVVVSYPKFNQADFEWIQSVREKHDNYYFDVVQPHFTFVFPTDKLDEDTFAAHINAKAKSFGPISFALTSAKVVEDDSRQFFHTFLIPSKGGEEITKLHDQLYTGDLESELRLDIPFIPHLGIGSSKIGKEMIELANDINSHGVNIVGDIDTLTIAKYDGKKVVDFKHIPLE